MSMVARSTYVAGLVALLILIGALRIVSTHAVFRQTVDQTAHAAAGGRWHARSRRRAPLRRAGRQGAAVTPPLSGWIRLFPGGGGL